MSINHRGTYSCPSCKHSSLLSYFRNDLKSTTSVLHNNVNVCLFMFMLFIVTLNVVKFYQTFICISSYLLVEFWVGSRRRCQMNVPAMNESLSSSTLSVLKTSRLVYQTAVMLDTVVDLLPLIMVAFFSKSDQSRSI